MPDRMTPTPPQQAKPDLEPVAALVSEVASLLGQKDSPRAREEALSALVRAAARLNGAGVWVQARTLATWTQADNPTADTEFGDADESLTTPADWAWPAGPGLAYDSDGNVVARMRWVAWRVYQRYYTRNSGTATPEMLAQRSPADNEILVWPPIRADSVARIEIPYFRRVAQFDSDDTLWLTPETREALISLAEYLLVKRAMRTSPDVVRTYYLDARSAVAAAKATTDRVKNELAGLFEPAELSNRQDWNASGDGTYTVRI